MKTTSKLELKDIVGYLPYGLKCKLSRKGVFNIDLEYTDERIRGIFSISEVKPCTNEIEIIRDDIDYSIGYIEIDEIMPILRPMSNLSKPITVDGHTFIPSKVLDYEQWGGDFGIIEHADYGEYPRVAINPISYIPEIDKLNEWHFDYRGLIDKGLAIDINTINQ